MAEAPAVGSNDGITTERRRKAEVPHILPGGEIVIFLPLQVALYFNAYFSPFWFLSSLVAQFYKISMVQIYVLVPLIAASVIVGLLEVLRIYLGYDGNLREKVSKLISYWFLILLQLALVSVQIAIGYVSAYLFPMELATDILFLLFLLSQLVLGVEAVRRMIRAQAVKFHLTQYQRLRLNEVPLTTMKSRTKLE